MNKINLERLWNTQKACKNPHKGWYFHYYDNGLVRYRDGLKSDEELERFPLLNHLYLRLAWSYLEPAEGEFRWEVIDEVIAKWLPKGFTFAFRITCKETGPDQVYATPEWVRQAGAQGSFTEPYSWEPDYGDPVFLQKLDNFHRAFAERYDGREWIEYIDIGSYGDWGEGHTASSSLRDWPADVIIRHIELHKRHYKRTTLMISDDIVGSRKVYDGSRETIAEYLVQNGIALRDDGVCVKWFADRFGRSTLRSPEMFERFWPRLPVDLELQHYHVTLEEHTWQEGVPFVAAVEEAHATFAGFHGYAGDWLRDNPALAVSLGNRLGYWYFFKSIELPASAEPCGPLPIALVIENRGVAPAYRRYQAAVRLTHADSPSVRYRFDLPGTDNRSWLPGRMNLERMELRLPDGMLPGRYRVAIALFDTRRDGNVPIRFGMTDAIVDDEGFHFLAELEVTDSRKAASN